MKQATFFIALILIVNQGLIAATELRDLKGNQFTLFQDVKNRVTEKFHSDGTQERLEYHLDGSLSCASYLYAGRPRTDIFEYDSQGKLIAHFSEVQDIPYHLTTYDYNRNGCLKRKQKADGNTLYYEYDENDRIQDIYDVNCSHHYRYTYDSFGHMTKAVNQLTDLSTLRTYNEKGSLIREQFENGLQVKFDYDLEGNKTTIELPDQSSIQYVYDEGKLKNIHRLSADQEIIYTHTIQQHDPDGKILTAKLIGNSGLITHTYDEQQRLKSIHTSHWSEMISYDKESGNINELKIREKEKTYSSKYSYDKKNQLVAEEGIFSNKFEYDNFSNLCAVNQINFEVNSCDQLLHDGQNFYSYDANGNRSKIEGANGALICNYDVHDQLILIEKPENFRIENLYDVFGRRITKKTWQWDCVSQTWNLNKVLHFFFDQTQELGATNEKGEIVELRVFGNGHTAEIGSPIAYEIEGIPYAAVHDHRGNCVCLLDIENGEPVRLAHFSAFGEEKVTKSFPFSLPWRFSSKRTEEETGWVYYGKRFYDPSTGRWLTQDPLLSMESPNRYTFLLNNPLNNVDPFGLFSISGTFWNLVQTTKSYYETFTQYANSLQLDVIQNELSFSNYIKNDLEELSLYLFGKKFLQFSGYYSSPPMAAVYGENELNPLIKITFVNGILNLKEDIMENACFISDTHGGNKVYYVFRPTQGWTLDLFSCALVKMGYISDTAKLLAETWKGLIEEVGGVGGEGKIIHYAHSIGGTDTYMAKSLLSPEEQKMIHVITLGSATMIPNIDFASVINYVSLRDGVSYLDPLGFLSGMFDESNVVYLGTLHGIPIIDHLLFMETYLEIMKLLGKEFLENLEEALEPMTSL